MSTSDQVEAKYLSHLRRAATALKEMEARLDAVQREKTEPIAIIGMGCRFPGGADTPERFWRLLDEGVDAVSEVPGERAGLDPASWASGEEPIPWGAFVDNVDQFDAEFFGISPREAAHLDPQQRLVLEVAWEALEHAGLPPHRLSRTRTGVFLGVNTNDYLLLSSAAGPDALDAYTATGNGHCFPAGRLSYFLGLEGPSLVVDTACSSSLVAVHLACQSLRSGESALALVGGVNLVLGSLMTRLIARLQALSPDGRCKTFDAQANGFVRGEGCGIAVLKRLSDALRDGDRVLAVIRGAAVNQDGRSTGLTAPSLLAQEAMLRQALENAGVSASEIGYVETHGTGTSLGDPIEVQALAEILGQPREDGSVCVLGAVKTNIGHLEAAAGIAGLMKVVLSLQRETIPANLHFKTLNPRIALEGTPFVIPTQKRAWPAGATPRLAGVSSFGMSGTNAHVVLAEAPPAVPAPPDLDDHAVLLPLSARTPKALADLAQAYQRFLTEAPFDAQTTLRDVAYTAGARRSHHEHRLSLVARSREELSELLGAVISGERRADIARGQATAGPRPRLVFVFSGQGSQWIGMGRELLAEEPVFRAQVEACDALLRQHASFSLLDELAAPDTRSRLDETAVAQPAIFAVQVALSALWASWGITPDAVIGHSVGEIAAAHVAGILSLDEAVRLVAIRGRVMQRATGAGKMASVALSEEEATAALQGYEDRLSIAAVNDPGAVVISGEPRALAELCERLRQRGVHCRPLRVNYAFHSPQMTPLQAELAAALGPMTPRRAALPMYSTVTGARVEGESLDTAYWSRNIREAVQLARAVEGAIADRHRIFVEVGPHPVLAGNLQQCLSGQKVEGHVIPTLRREQQERRCLLQSLGVLYTQGHPLDFQRLYPAEGRVVSVPTYPWQRQRCWLKATSPRLEVQRGAASGHPLLGARLSVAGARAVFEKALGQDAIPYLADHRLFDRAVVPGAALMDLVLAAAAASLGRGRARVTGLSFDAPLLIPEAGVRRVQVVLSEATDDGTPVAVYSQVPDASPEDPWTVHATGRLHLASEPESPASVDRGALLGRCPLRVPVAGVEQAAVDAGLVRGAAFQCITALWRGDGEAVAQVELGALVESEASAHGATPALLDAALQTLLAALGDEARAEVSVPSTVQELTVWQAGASRAWVHAKASEEASGDMMSGDILVVDDAGNLLVALTGVRMQRADRAALGPPTSPTWTERLSTLPPEARAAEVEAAVRADVATVLMLSSSDDIPVDRPLPDLGMDSLMAVQLRHELSGRTGQPLSATLALDHPTVQALTHYLLSNLPLDADPSDGRAPDSRP